MRKDNKIIPNFLTGSRILDQIKKMPDSPGVYFFKDEKGGILYIGKATSLRDRVRSYYSSDILTTRGPLIAQLLECAVSVDFEKTDSVLEALILEAELIRKHKPKHNTDLKDDKSWNYVVITKEDFPRVLLIRERVLVSDLTSKYKYTFGPFTNGLQLKEAMKIVRRIFPYRDTCVPMSGKPCFNAQIRLCPGVCSGAISKTEYARTIRNIALFFRGKKKSLVAKLTKEMKAFAKNEEFEKAAKLKKTIFALGHIHDVSLLKRDTLSNFAYAKFDSTFRIECYDIAHLGGTDTVGAMTVVENGEAAKAQYRKFKIRGVGVNDTAHLSEVLDRRLAHNEWPMPNIIAVDGGAAQVNAVKKVLTKYGIEIPVVGVVKDEHHRAKMIIGDESSARKYEKDILLADSEAHRFAIGYHKKLRGKIKK
ncbi:MAG: UvrB/UvrC motif-containing protein [Candidatus Paceibacterota bacterium]|jgi:excinuclease ABC subunit C